MARIGQEAGLAGETGTFPTRLTLKGTDFESRLIEVAAIYKGVR